MTGLRRRELEAGIDGERLAEFVSTQLLAARGAMNESEVLVRARELLLAQALVDRPLEVFG